MIFFIQYLLWMLLHMQKLLFILSYLLFLLSPFLGYFHAIMHALLLVEAKRSLSKFNSMQSVLNESMTHHMH